MKFVFLLFVVAFACEVVCRVDATKAEDASSVTQAAAPEVGADDDAADGKQQEIESKETDDSKLADDDTTKQESSTESGARGDGSAGTTNVADTDRKAEPTTPASPEKPRDDESGFGEEGTVVEANPNPPPQAPQPVDPFYRPPVIYNVPSAWPPVNYPSYPSYPGFEFGYPGVGYNPWLQQRVQACPPGFTLVYSRIGEGMCRRASIFHNFYAATHHL